MADGNDPDALFRRYRREAVLLHRSWPPQAGPPTNSQLGGLPRLPESYAWPRTSGGTPLHFLAQVDCADIRFKTALPERGVLFFFGRDDDEQVWNFEPPASDDCRVLYALDAFALTPPRQPPDDLPPIRGRKDGPNVHHAWPVVPFRFDSFPDASALPEAIELDERGWRRFVQRYARGVPGASKGLESGAAMRDAYREQLNARRVAALVAASGAAPPQTGDDIDSRHVMRAGTAILATAGSHAFPRHWAYIHHLAHAVVDRHSYYSYGGTGESERIEAGRWLARSREVPLDQPVAEDDRQALRAWLASLKRPTEPSEMGSRAATLAFAGAVGTIRAWAGDPALAALVPDEVYAACAPWFHTYNEDDPQFAQMLGHAPSAQDALPADDPTVCLLNLETERGMGWEWGDGGQCTFWIDPRDLARRDFSKVEGTIVGH